MLTTFTLNPLDFDYSPLNSGSTLPPMQFVADSARNRPWRGEPHVRYRSGNNMTKVGIAPNELTSMNDKDFFAGTPWHKFVPAKIEKVL